MSWYVRSQRTSTCYSWIPKEITWRTDSERHGFIRSYMSIGTATLAATGEVEPLVPSSLQTGKLGTARQCSCFTSSQTFPTQSFMEHRKQRKTGRAGEGDWCSVRSNVAFLTEEPARFPRSPSASLTAFSLLPQDGRGAGAWEGPIYRTWWNRHNITYTSLAMWSAHVSGKSTFTLLCNHPTIHSQTFSSSQADRVTIKH